MEVHSRISALLNIQEQLRGEVQHLQDLRAKLITTYFLILGGTGYLANFILTNPYVGDRKWALIIIPASGVRSQGFQP